MSQKYIGEYNDIERVARMLLAGIHCDCRRTKSGYSCGCINCPKFNKRECKISHSEDEMK